jgi:hypothetical protein
MAMSGFRGIDPDGLVGLGRVIEGTAAEVLAAGNLGYALLARHDRLSAADRFAMAMRGIACRLDDEAAEMMWRAEAIRRGQQMTFSSVPSSLVADVIWEEAQFAAVARFTVADRQLSFERWRSGSPTNALAKMTPGRVAAVFAEMLPAEIDRMLLEDPAVVGGLDGAPPWLRCAASRVLIGREMDRLGDLAAELEDRINQLEDALWGGHSTQERLMRAMHVAELDLIEERVAMYGRWLSEGRQILTFDPQGDGRVAEVFGDLDEAGYVGVIVPGIANDIDNFGPLDGGGFRAHAEQLYEEAVRLEPDVATIAWLGYDTPDGAGAALRRSADDGHRHLIAFTEGLAAANSRPHLTIIGHSYGSLVTGMAAGAGLAVDDVVFVGSPGTSLARASDAVIESGGRVWAGLAHRDPIGAGIDPLPDSVWELMLGPIGAYMWDSVATGDFTMEDLWHGRNPVHESFDAIEFRTDGAEGHSQYFGAGTESLANLARIVAGLDFAVRLVGDGRLERDSAKAD